MSIITNKQLIKEAFANVVENMDVTEETYTKYFSENYQQRVDGKILNYIDFVSHMKVQKTVMQTVRVTFRYMVAEENRVATIHVVNGVKKDGGTIEAQVNAIFQISENKIILCDELTHLIKGDKSDKDLGSRK